MWWKWQDVWNYYLLVCIYDSSLWFYTKNVYNVMSNTISTTEKYQTQYVNWEVAEMTLGGNFMAFKEHHGTIYLFIYFRKKEMNNGV